MHLTIPVAWPARCRVRVSPCARVFHALRARQVLFHIRRETFYLLAEMFEGLLGADRGFSPLGEGDAGAVEIGTQFGGNALPDDFKDLFPGIRQIIPRCGGGQLLERAMVQAGVTISSTVRPGDLVDANRLSALSLLTTGRLPEDVI
jgi:hypothetical protein